MVEEKEEFEMGLPNGVGEQMLAHAFEKFDIKLEQTEFGPKLIGEYDELVKAIGEAIDREAAENNTTVIDHHIETPVIERSFEEIREEARALWESLVGKDVANADKIGKIIQEVFGRPIKLSEITEAQKDLFELVVVAMKEL
jgi:hypothetical protein